MKKTLMLAVAALAFLSTSAFAATINAGQVAHAADKATGYTFVNPDLNTSVGTLQTRSSTSVTVDKPSNWNAPAIGDNYCVQSNGKPIFWGYGFSVGSPVCVPRSIGEYENHNGTSETTVTNLCNQSVHTYTFNPQANARDQAVTITQTSGAC